MPTTRSRKRPSEALTSLSETPKKPRKRRIHVIPRVPTISLSPDQEEDCLPSIEVDIPTSLPSLLDVSAPLHPFNPEFLDASTQTAANLYVLTRSELDVMIDEAIDRKIASNKRAREDIEDDTPIAKRVDRTPSSTSDYGFLFSRPPNTAPTKGAFMPSSTPTRIVRGPISKRNVSPLNRHRRAPLHNSVGNRQTPRAHPTELKPVDVAPAGSQSVPPKSHTTGDIKIGGSNTDTLKPQPAQRGIFGSIRGLAQSGFQFAMNLSPRKTSSIASQHTNQIPQSGPVLPDQNTSNSADDQDLDDANNGKATVSVSTPTRRTKSGIDTSRQTSARQQSSRYDHLHYVKPGSEEEKKLAAGEWIPPPRAPTPPDEFEVARKENPDMPEWMIRNLLAKRARRNDMQREASGPASAPPKIAPLFGPDSHYARGTVDPRFVSPRSYRMHAKYPNLVGGSVGSKRTFDVFDTDQKVTQQHQQPSVEDTDDQSEEDDDEVQDDDTAVLNTPLAKKQRMTIPATPRSALKKQNDFSNSIGRSGRSVNFNADPVSGSRGLRAHYGPAGQYKGSTFADLSSPTSPNDSMLSAFGHDDILSSSTKLNTLANMKASRIQAMEELEKNLGANVPEIDFTLRDPNDPDWRPSLSNPRPGAFRVPDVDEESDSDDDTAKADTIASGAVPPQPSTPRMSHAELPSASSSDNTLNDSGVQFETTEVAIEKARSKAQKYKPKDSSRLSEVSLSHSRSPSPESDETPRALKSFAPAVQAVHSPAKSWSHRTPYVEAPLDKTTIGEDGLTDYEREHQYDNWAVGLDWGIAQTYEDAGTGTKEIHDLIRKNWTQEDSRRSEEFWQKEFDDINMEQKKARARGQLLRLITGMEDLDQYVDKVF